MNQFNEDNLIEQTVIKLLKGVWNDENCHVNAFSDEEDLKLGRENRGEVVLKKYLEPAITKINDGLPKDVIDQAITELTRD